MTKRRLSGVADVIMALTGARTTAQLQDCLAAIEVDLPRVILDGADALTVP